MVYLIIFTIAIISSIIYIIYEKVTGWLDGIEVAKAFTTAVLGTVAVGLLILYGTFIYYKGIASNDKFIPVIEENCPLVDVENSTFVIFDMDTEQYNFIYRNSKQNYYAVNVSKNSIVEIIIAGDQPRVTVETWHPKSWFGQNTVFNGADKTMYRIYLPSQNLLKITGYTKSESDIVF